MQEEMDQVRSLLESFSENSLVRLQMLKDLENLENNEHHDKSMYVYSIELEGGFYYVGSSSDPMKRFELHMLGEGSSWTKLHRPVQIIRQRKVNGDDGQARIDEDAEVKRLVKKYGIDQVRGGSYSQVKLSAFELKVFQRELWHCDDACIRCGCQTHWVNNCFATYDINGNEILENQPDSRFKRKSHNSSSNIVYIDQSTQRPIFPLNSCGICGRIDHKEKNCMEILDVNKLHINCKNRKTPIKRKSIHDDVLENQMKTPKQTINQSQVIIIE